MKQYWMGFVIGFIFGGSAGMGVMFTAEQPKPQPVVVHSETPYATPALDAALDKLKTSIEVHFIRQEAALSKMQQDTVKLSTINKAMAAQLIERESAMRVAQDGAAQTREVNTELRRTQQARDAAPLSIQQMAKELGVSELVVK